MGAYSGLGAICQNSLQGWGLFREGGLYGTPVGGIFLLINDATTFGSRRLPKIIQIPEGYFVLF